jgi:NADPH-dependent glutamate synthase beta subunit-like oxidoreductase
MLHFGIPAYRLPRDVLMQEISRIEAMGVKIVLNHKIDDLLAEQTKGTFDAVYVAIGTQTGRHVDILTQDSAHVLTAVSLLREVGGGGTPKLGQRVVIYGAGDTAMDAARTAKRLGAEDVLIVFFSDHAHMEAHSFEADEALSEGIKIKWLSSIHEIGETSVKVELMALDSKGVPQPTGKFETLEAESVILALGQQAESAFLSAIPGISMTADGTVLIGSDMMTGHPGIFAGGDLVPSARTVTTSVGHGKKAALNIDGWLRQQAYVPPLKHPLVSFSDLHLPLYSDATPSVQRDLSPARRLGFSEITAGFTEALALHEARRCLSCGNCFECNNCFAACPETAIVKLGPTHGYRVDMALCTGCAVCVDQCPCSAMTMVPESVLQPTQTMDAAK